MTDPRSTARAHADEAERLLSYLDSEPTPEEYRARERARCDGILEGPAERFAEEMERTHARAIALANTHATLALYYHHAGDAE